MIFPRKPVPDSTPDFLASAQRRKSQLSLPAAPEFSVHSAEGEDAELTGMTRSLHRRAMALNFPVVRLPQLRQERA